METGGSLADAPGRPVWQRRWFQWLVGLLVGLLVLSFILPPLFAVVYEVRAILVPVLIALGLAYVVNPAITAAHQRFRVPRWAGAGAILALGGLVVLTFLLLALPPIIAQGTELFVKLKDVYPQRVIEWIEEAPTTGVGGVGVEATPAEATAAEPTAAEAAEPLAGAAQGSWLDRARDPDRVRLLLGRLVEFLRGLEWSQVAGVARQSLDVGVGVVGTAIGFVTYLLLAAVIVVFCFFFFAWRFDRITAWFGSFIPATRREQALRILGKMDRSIAAFIRGRLVQSFVMMVILSVGWWIAGVPYWLLLGVLSGLLNLVPFVAVVGWLAALLLTIIDHAAGPHGLTLWTFLGPTLVYVIAQSVDGWVVEPTVQGKATDLDPITVLLVVLIGGALAGLLGMLIAIPTAACVKILARDVALPRLRTLAAKN